MNLTFRPRLTRGAHLTNTDGTGCFCLVEAIGYNVDQTVSDHHPSIDTVLAAMGRAMNDRICKHYEHPLAEAAGFLEPDRTGICDECQARLWAAGERIAGTRNQEISDDHPERAALHVHLAIVAAKASLKAIDPALKLHVLAEAAIEAAQICLDTPLATTEPRRIARAAANDVDNEAVHLPNSGQAWAGYAAASAARAAARYSEGIRSSTEGFATVAAKAVEAVTYAVGAYEGEAGSMMGLARRVLNAYWKFVREAAARAAGFLEAEETACEKSTSQNATSGAAPAEPYRPAIKGVCPHRTTVDGIGYPCINLGEHVEHNTALGAAWWTVETPTEEYNVIHPDDAGAAAAEAAEPQHAEAAYREAEALVADKMEAAYIMSGGIGAAFEESELAEVADEAIGDVAALMADLERAEAILNAITIEHGAVEQLVRTSREDGTDASKVTEYYQDCCVVCRDAKGRPMPFPCRTMQIVQGFGE